MTVRSLDVGVVGAGTAGTSAALLLARAGHRVRIYEAVAKPEPVGAGIMLQPSGMGVLARLGLLERVLDHGARCRRLHAITEGGWTVLDLSYTDFDRRAFGLGLHRGVLFDTLFDAADAADDVEIRCGHAVETLRERGGRRVLFDAEDLELGDHDLVVVADGARSQLRDDTRLTRRASMYPWGALWAVLPDPERAFAGELFQVLSGTREMLGFLPTGQGPSGGSVPLVSLFWSVHAERVEQWRHAGVSAWKSRVCRLEPRAEAVLDAVRDPDDLLFARYHDVVLDPWHVPAGIVYIGDAAHATSPQLGQGANLALCDAAALADALQATDSLAEGLDRYSRERRDHLRYYQWATRMLTPFFQSDATPLGWLRDGFMGLACKLPWIRTKMLRTMCGLERGILAGSPLPMPALPGD